MRLKFLVVLALALCLSACSRAKDTVIPSDPSKWSEISDQTKTLDDEDKQLLARYMLRNSLGNVFTHSGGIPPGTTIGEAIDQQKDFETKEKIAQAQADALKARALAARNAVLEKLNHLITFALVSKQYVPKDIMAERFSDQISFVFAVKNNTQKDIAGIKGIVEFRDMFDTPIENMNLSLDHTVPAQKEVTIDGYEMDVNPFKDNDQKLAATDLSKMKVRFVPEMIVFADGTNEKAPEEPQ